MRAEDLAATHHDLSEWMAHDEVREAMRPIIADIGHTAQLLASRRIALSNAARDRFLDVDTAALSRAQAQALLAFLKFHWREDRGGA